MNNTNIIEDQNPENLPSGVVVENLAPCIDYYSNMITLDNASFIINTAEQHNKNKNHLWKFKEAKVGNDGLLNKFIRSNQTMELNFNALNNFDISGQQVRQIIIDAVSSAVRHYSFKYNVQIAADEGFTLLKYQTGSEYKPHCDAGIGQPFSDRTLSMVMYLNPTEYTGGETYFNNFDISVKPNHTGLVLFPSNYAYTHQAKPVETGTKYAIVTWLRQPFE